MFDPKLNADNLQQCLVKVLKLEDSSTSSVAREEFEAYYVLSNLGELYSAL